MGGLVPCPADTTPKEWNKQEYPTINELPGPRAYNARKKYHKNILKKITDTTNILNDPEEKTIIQMREKLLKPKSFCKNLVIQKAEVLKRMKQGQTEETIQQYINSTIDSNVKPPSHHRPTKYDRQTLQLSAQTKKTKISIDLDLQMASEAKDENSEIIQMDNANNKTEILTYVNRLKYGDVIVTHNG
eukprot:411586_1